MTTSSPAERGNVTAATAVWPGNDGSMTTEVVEGWDVLGVPHGGYLMATLASAARYHAEQDAPLAVTANYLSAPRFGPAEIAVEVVRTGKRQTTVQTRLRQQTGAIEQTGTIEQTGAERVGPEQAGPERVGPVEKVRATVTLGQLSEEPPRHYLPSATMPAVGGPDDFIDAEARVSDEERDLLPRLYRHVETRYHPDTGFLVGRFDGPPRLQAWCRLSHGHPTEALALLVFADGLLPSIVAHSGFTVGHVPTLQLTTYLHAQPSSDWVFVESSTAVRGGNFVEEDYRLWDLDGRLVGTSRQLALVRDS